MWDEMDSFEGDKRLEELRDNWWVPMMKKGAKEHALRQKNRSGPLDGDTDGLTTESVNGALQAVVASRASSKDMHSSRTAIQGELQQGKQALNTAAARVLYKQAGKHRKRLQEDLVKLESEEAATRYDDMSRETMRKKLDDAQRELSAIYKEEAQLAEGGARSSIFRLWV